MHNALKHVELSEARALQHVKDIEHRDQALRDAQQQLHLITDTMSALVSRCTPDLKYSWVSKPYADWLRRTRSEIISASIEQTIGKDGFEVLQPYYQRDLRLDLTAHLTAGLVSSSISTHKNDPKKHCFTQANHSLERQHGGLGIGLALVKRLVEMHEGEVSAGANPAGQGSEFLVRLPLMSFSETKRNIKSLHFFRGN